ncbi:hypothetical protein EON83_16865 [bacterium]|nr:MAG: hypothetical protein EON83_16865 [bacterium]
MKIPNLNWKAKWILGAVLVVPWLWNWFYYVTPKAAYYELARAVEVQDAQKLKQLAEPHILADLPGIAKMHGGMRKFGQGMRQSSDVGVAIHMIGTVDLFATVNKRPYMIQFTLENWRWKAVVLGEWW